MLSRTLDTSTDSPQSPQALRQAAYRQRQREKGINTSGAAQRRRAKAEGRSQSKGRKPVMSHEWLCVDTEGATDTKGIYGDIGRQYTFCAVASDASGEWTNVLHTGKPLSTHEILWWICGLPRPREYRLCGYYWGYDIAQITADLGEDNLRRLYGSGVDQLPVLWQRWILSLFHTSLTIIAPRDLPNEHPDELKGVPGLRRQIWDVGRFYNARLTVALGHWKIATDDELILLEEMKESRGDFTIDSWAKDTNDIINYALLECRLTARMQKRFDDACREGGFPLKAWYGAGSAAKAMLKAHNIREHLDSRRSQPKDFREHLPHTYYGGRFEILAPGEYSPVYEYDLRSAYPASYRTLPCLIHSHWTKSRNLTTIEPHDLYSVNWNIPTTHHWGPFPERRKNGTIHYPSSGYGYIWGIELAAALEIWSSKQIRIDARWRRTGKCDCQIWQWVNEEYQRRIEMGKNARGMAIKLALNAIYGTLASVLGANTYDNTIKGWCEPIWAALITAWVRAQLLHGLKLAGGPRSTNLIMMATDAIYTTTPIQGLNLIDELGEWESHIYPSGLLVQPGVYHLRGDPNIERMKGRGVELKAIKKHIRMFRHAWEQHGTEAKVSIPLPPRYISPRLALHRNRLETAWRWVQENRDISFNPTNKREMRKGQWMPYLNLSSNGNYPHTPFANLINGVLDGPPPVAPEQLEQQYLNDAQPNGPMT